MTDTLATDVKRHRFSTRGYNPAEGVDRWERHNERELVGLDCLPLGDGPLRAAQISASTRVLRLAHVRASAHIVERTGRHVEAHDDDGVALYFSLGGDAVFHARAGNQVQRRGTVLAFDTRQPFARKFASGVDELVLTIERETFEAAIAQPVSQAPVVRSFRAHGDVFASAIAHEIQRVLASPAEHKTPVDDRRILDLVGAMFTPDASMTARGRRAAATLWIERNLHNASLSAGDVAEGIGVSERHLRRAFEHEHLGVARTILEKRLAVAYAALCEGAATSIGDLAAQIGFNSATHFSRAFRERYGYAPSELKRAS